MLIDHATWAEEASITPRFLPSNVIGGYIRDCREAPSPLSKGRYPLRPIGATKEWDAMTDAQKRQYSDNPSLSTPVLKPLQIFYNGFGTPDSPLLQAMRWLGGGSCLPAGGFRGERPLQTGLT